MKKIDCITFAAPTITGGGAERVVSVLSSSLADMGYHVDLILYERRNNEYPLSPKVNVHLLPARKDEQNKVVYLINKFMYLRNLLRKLKPDVLIPFLPYQVEQCFFASRGLGIPFVVTVRNNPQYDTPNEKMRKRRDWIAKHADAVFLQTKTQREYFPSVVKEKCFVAANPVSDEIIATSYGSKDKLKRLIAVGRLEEQKNFPMLINAFSRIYNKFSDITLDIYGEGNLQKQLQRQISDLGLNDAVKLCGRSYKIATVLAEHDLFIMSSDYEGMPNALMEALGVGLPCISTDCPTGPAELLGNNERGLLFSVGQEDELVNRIDYAINNPPLMCEMARRAKIYIKENFASESIAKLFISELKKGLR